MITKKEYLELHGLFILAERHVHALADIIKAIAETAGEELDEDGYGHADDAAYSGGQTSVDEYLGKLGYTDDPGFRSIRKNAP